MRILMLLLIAISLLTSSCAAIRGLGLSESGVNGIRDILVSEALDKGVERYCERPVDERIELTRTLLKAQVNLTAVKC